MNAAALAPVVDAFHQAQVANYAAVSALALLLYDVAITLGLEIAHIWSAKWTVPKAMYLFSRYYALIHLCLVVRVGTSTTNSLTLYGLEWTYLCAADDVPRCRAYIHIIAFGPQAVSIVTDVLIIMRLRAMYYKSFKVTIILAVLFSAQMISETIVAVFATENPAIHAPAPLVGNLQGCLYIHGVQHYLLASWVPALSFATFLFGLTVFKLWEFRRDGSKATGLFLLFATDGSIFFAMIFCLLLLATLTTVFAPAGRLADVGIPWLTAVYGIVTSRLILNLREYMAVKQRLESSPSKMTSIHFGLSGVAPGESSTAMGEPEGAAGFLPKARLAPRRGRAGHCATVYAPAPYSPREWGWAM